MKNKILSVAAMAFAIFTASNADASARNNGEYCREYTETIKIGRKTETGYGTACLQPDGSWEKQGKADFSNSYKRQPTRAANTTVIIDERPLYNYRPAYFGRRSYYGHRGYRNQPSYFNISFGNSRKHRYGRYGKHRYYKNAYKHKSHHKHKRR